MSDANALNKPPMLYIFSGLPGTGKTTLARALSQRLGAFYLRIDTIEQALRDLCSVNVQGEGSRLAYRLAADNLNLGFSVVADSCNPVDLTRREWQNVARAADAAFLDIEVVCNDTQEHRRRVECRTSDIEGLALPTWDAVASREYHPWSSPRLVVDTEGCSIDDALTRLLERIAEA